MMVDCTGIAVHLADHPHWIALCPEYDISADGRTWSEAFSRLAGAIEKAVETAQAEKLAVGRPVPEDAIAKFVASHASSDLRPVRRYFQIDTDKVEVLTVATEMIFTDGPPRPDPTAPR